MTSDFSLPVPAGTSRVQYIFHGHQCGRANSYRYIPYILILFNVSMHGQYDVQCILKAVNVYRSFVL